MYRGANSSLRPNQNLCVGRKSQTGKKLVLRTNAPEHFTGSQVEDLNGIIARGRQAQVRSNGKSLYCGASKILRCRITGNPLLTTHAPEGKSALLTSRGNDQRLAV